MREGGREEGRVCSPFDYLLVDSGAWLTAHVYLSPSLAPSLRNGGWCMHDEATAHYVGMIDQTTLGHRFLAATFGAKHLPRVGWQVRRAGRREM